MRASRRRSHHSVWGSREAGSCRARSAAGRNLPRRIAPLASIRSKDFSMSDALTPSKPPSSAAVVGPRCVIQPWTAVRMASSLVELGLVLLAASVAGEGPFDSRSGQVRATPANASGCSAANISARSAATQNFRSRTSATTARRSATRRSKKARHPAVDRFS